MWESKAANTTARTNLLKSQIRGEVNGIELGECPGTGTVIRTTLGSLILDAGAVRAAVVCRRCSRTLHGVKATYQSPQSTGVTHRYACEVITPPARHICQMYDQ